jgi:hypothetical protein
MRQFRPLERRGQGGDFRSVVECLSQVPLKQTARRFFQIDGDTLVEQRFLMPLAWAGVRNMDNKPFSGRLLILVFAVAACFPSPVVWSAAPEVTFDIPFTIECRDVTPKGFRETHPSEKIIEAKFRVSMRITKGIEKDIKDLVYVIDSPERRLNVSDFIPRTKLGSEVAGTISIVETAENSLGGALAVKYEAAEATGQASQKKTRTESYTKLPPKELVLASGTVNREHGVFFKLRPSSDDSLEGMKEFACLFAVPKEWRGDEKVG